MKESDLGNEEANDIGMDFIEALEYGIDRLCMLFAEMGSIREAILFPTMKNRD